MSELTAKHDREIVKREAAEVALGESEEVFRLLVEAVRDYAIFVLDTQGNILTWNEGARRLKGYEATEIIGQHFSRFYTPEDIARNHPQWELEQATKNGTYEEEGWRLKKDGSRFWANVIITTIRDAEGKHIGFSKVTRDLTEKKKAEDALQEAYQSLEKRVEQRTNELAKAKEVAERAVQARDEFFSIASHELRTPLTSLKLKSQIAKRQFRNQAPLSEEGQRFQAFVSATDDQLERLNRLVEDMLDLTRSSQGTLSMEPSHIDLGDVARSVVERMSHQFKERNTPLELKACPSVLIWADPLRTEQVLLNLLSNALRYAPGAPVRIELSQEDGIVRLSITDEGPGIAKENHEQIFNRYERLAPTFNKAGLGIGLYLARLIVEAQKGRVYVESELGKGAKFILEFPVADANMSTGLAREIGSTKWKPQTVQK